MTSMDLNLMRTLVLLYKTRSVTKTAAELHITQPSVSYALRRLRHHFNDELFVRSSDGLQPTDLAEQMYPSLHQALEVIDETISGARAFDPNTSQRAFRLHPRRGLQTLGNQCCQGHASQIGRAVGWRGPPHSG
jgi:DNA-binding transcriptional LysR family regulator